MNNQRIKVWDPLVRLSHLLLAGGFFVAYFTEDDFLSVHSWAGYLVAAVIITRTMWGFIGTRYARFSNFVYRPAIVKQFLRDTLKLRAPAYTGHNPAGGWMIVMLLISVFITAMSGMALYGATEHAGPLSNFMAGTSHFTAELLEGIHEVFANLSIFLVVIHVCGVIVESLLHHENLVRAMINGYKTYHPETDIKQIHE